MAKNIKKALAYTLIRSEVFTCANFITLWSKAVNVSFGLDLFDALFFSIPFTTYTFNAKRNNW